MVPTSLLRVGGGGRACPTLGMDGSGYSPILFSLFPHPLPPHLLTAVCHLIPEVTPSDNRGMSWPGP